MDSSNLQHGAICAVGAGTLLIALCLALFLNRLCPSSNPFRFPFLHPPVFARHHRKGGLVFLESPAPYGGILSTRVVGIFPRTSFPTARCLPAVASGAPLAPLPCGQKLRFWLICLTAVGSFVLQVWDSASSRLLADFHHRSRIASVVPGKLLSIFMERSFLN